MRSPPADNAIDAPGEVPRLARIDRPSKTKLKQQSHDLQNLGLAVAQLPAERFAALPLPESLREAIVEYRRTRSHEGRRRQLQLVGKLMRAVDEAPLREAVAAAKLGSAKETLLLHETERWRDALLADDAALTPFLNSHPGADAQSLRSLVRAARRDAAKPEAQRNPRAARELFQQLRPLVASSLASQFPEHALSQGTDKDPEYDDHE